MRLIRADRARPPVERVDPQAWADAYRGHGDRLTRLATVLVGPADATDLVVDTMRRVVHRRPHLTGDDLAAYLTRALVNSARSHRRSDQRRIGRERRTAASDLVVAIDPSNSIDVRRALDLLSPQQRAILALVFWDDLTIPDVAVRLGVSQGTVRRQYARAKTRLREVLQ